MGKSSLICPIFITEDYHCGFICFIRMAKVSLSELYMAKEIKVLKGKNNPTMLEIWL